MSRPEDPDVDTKISGKPKNIKAGVAKEARRANHKEKKPPKRITETYLHNSGLYYLQRFAASTGQFRNVMQRKIETSCRHYEDQSREHCFETLEKLITKFQSVGLLNDENYARGMVISLRRRGISVRAIMMKLQNKGLNESQIREALNIYNEENDVQENESEFRAALRLAQRKRVGPYARPEGFDQEKALSAFARAGFSFDLARRVLGMGADDLNDDQTE